MFADLDQYTPGTKVYDRTGKMVGKVLKPHYSKCACGDYGKIKVLWPDGKYTLLCPAGIIEYKDGYKIS